MAAWIVYALLVPLLYAGVGLFDKFLRKRYMGTVTLSIFGGLAFLLAFAILPFVGLPTVPFVLLPGLLAGALLFASNFPYFQALSIEETSRVVPLWALEAPITLLMAFLFLNERLTTNHYAGFVLIVTGAFIVSAKSVGHVLRLTPAFFLMLLASFFTSAAIILNKWLYNETSFWSVQLLLAVGSGAAALLTLAAITVLNIKHLKKAMAHNLFSIKHGALLWLGLRYLTVIAGYLMLNFAVRNGSPSLSIAFVPLAGLYVFVAAVALRAFLPNVLKEVVDKKTLLTKAAGIFLVIAGVFAINLR